MKCWPALDLLRPRDPGGAPDGWQDILAAALDDFHPTAIQEQDDLWRVFFGSPEDRDRAMRALAGGQSWLALSPVDVDDEDWARRSQEALRPVKVGRVVITPPWLAGSLAGASDIEIVILPSMGFGTGHHASTRLCAALLQELDLPGRSLLDVGTGSGVLALVALKLGVAHVEAVDDDGDAVAAAAENFELNGATGRIRLRQADFRDVPSLSADVVTANLTGALLVRSARLLAAAVRPGGSLIVSGVTVEEDGMVVEAFRPHLRLASRLAEDGWVGLLFRHA
jgi:ribosomal protein L11 methyltransferase